MANLNGIQKINLPDPILVTGAHRTGTTWAGKMLAASGQAAYISEPLNVLHRPGVLRAPVQRWYTYICKHNEVDYYIPLREMLHYRYHILAELRSLRSAKDVLRMGRDWSIFFRGQIFHRRPLLKDPFAVFSAPWFARRLGCQVVITIRHPAGFASSLKRLNWPFDFGDLLSQPLLMQDWLDPFRGDMEKAARMPEDIVAHASLLWRMVYQVVAEHRKDFPQFIVVRHEDLSTDPIQRYRELYDQLGLRFTPRAQRAILNSSGADNPKELSSRSRHSVHLDSQANLNNWKRRLTADEIACIRLATEEIAWLYYPDLTWE